MTFAPKRLPTDTPSAADLVNHATHKPTERWRKTVLPLESTLHAAIRNLDASALQIILVVSLNDVLIGTITDGDIRRGLLQGLDLGSPIASIVHREPLVVPPQMPGESVRQLMLSNRVRQLPIVSNERIVVGLHLWDEVMEQRVRPNLMVIMAGGRGVRLRPYTENCPKPLLLVRGKPMLEHIIERAKAEGFQRFVLAIHYLGDMIKHHFGNGSRWGVEIEYLEEESPLGTAGAMALLSPKPAVPFIVTNGDVLTDVRYGELLDFHTRHGATATMAVRLHEWQHPFGVVRTEGVNIIGFDEKPISRSHINAGIYALNPDALGVLENGKACDMPALFRELQARSERTIVYPIHEPWLDVGGTDAYTSAQEDAHPLSK
jgi:dTDP-glucose pyrophosphorylase